MTTTAPQLRPCKDCGHMVSPKAETCPSCGRQRPGGGVSASVLILTGIVGTLIAVLVIYSANQASQRFTDISNDLNSPPVVATSP